MPWSLRESVWEAWLKDGLASAGNAAKKRLIASGDARATDRVFEVRLMKAGAPGALHAAIIETIKCGDLLVFDLAGQRGAADGNPNVLFELGVAFGLGRDENIYLLRSVGSLRPNVPSDLAGLVMHGRNDLGASGSLHGLLREAILRKWRSRKTRKPRKSGTRPSKRKGGSR